MDLKNQNKQKQLGFVFLNELKKLGLLPGLMAVGGR